MNVIKTDLSGLLKSVTKDIKKDFDISTRNAEVVEYLSTGSPAINYAFSGRFDGGFPTNRLSELAGDNACVTGDTIIDIIIVE